MNQFIIIGRADDDTATARCLLTRRVFTSLDAALKFADSCVHRDPEIVECYFPVPDSLYRADWQPVRGAGEERTGR